VSRLTVFAGKAAVRQQLLECCKLAEQNAKISSLLFVKIVPVRELFHPKDSTHFTCLYVFYLKMITHGPSQNCARVMYVAAISSKKANQNCALCSPVF